MNADDLFDALEHIDPKLIEDADRPSRRKNAWIGWIAAAACLCVAVGVLLLRQPTAPSASDVLQWSDTMSAADYFKNNPKGDGSYAPPPEASIVMPPYAASLTLSSAERSALEEAGVLPPMPEHPAQDFQVQYNSDGSLYKAVFLWMRRGNGLEGYSDLSLTAAPREIHEIDDVITVYDTEVPVTVTERDGILITAEGCEGIPKTLTWRTEQGWYQLSGSWNDKVEDLAALLDWFWAHPLDLAQFMPPPEETIREVDPADYPDAFRDAIPDFAALGYAAESERLTVSHGDPAWFEGVYTRGDTRIVWTVDTGADADDWAACPGRPEEVTREILNTALADKDYVNLFIDTGPRPLMATLRLESGTSDDAWTLIQDLAA